MNVTIINQWTFSTVMNISIISLELAAWQCDEKECAHTSVDQIGIIFIIAGLGVAINIEL